MTLSAISVSDMHCARCVAKIEAALAGEEGVLATFINPARKQVLVEHTDRADPLRLLERIEQAGFHPLLGAQSTQRSDQRDLLKRLGIAGLSMMQVMMTMLVLYSGHFEGIEFHYRQLFEYASLLCSIPVVTYAAVPFYVGAMQSVRRGFGNLTMDVPIALAILAAFVHSLYNTVTGIGEVYYDSVTMFAFLLLTARYVDDRLKQRFEVTNANLAALPAQGMVLRDGQRETVPLESIATGSRVWVEEGSQVPLDGAVVAGVALLDESLLTGESLEVRREAGAPVFAGTLNRGAGFEMQTTATFDHTRVAGIADLANRAQADKPAVAQFADRIARWFVPGVLVLAAVSWLAWQFFDPDRAFVAALTVLVVSCPCALSLATPATFTAAMTRLRQSGIVLTRSAVLEQIPTISAAVLDKTGTLTVHAPTLQRIEALRPAQFDETLVLDIAAALQRHASHPIARAFPEPVAAVVQDVRVVTGAGVEGVWKGHPVRIGKASFCSAAEADDGRAVLLAIDDAIVARFLVDDPIRPDARAAIRALEAEGIVPRMVSGDSPERCRDLAEQLGIAFIARQTPETKLEIIRDLQSRGERVLAVGDGINDIPALAAADVSVTVLESSDLVRSKTDVLLLNRRLGALIDLVRVAKRTRSVLHQNLAWSLGYNLVAVPLAALGFMVPWVAAVGMASSSVLVMLNASRLLRAQERDWGQRPQQSRREQPPAGAVVPSDASGTLEG
jgi:Cu2+-exporting ATPase